MRKRESSVAVRRPSRVGGDPESGQATTEYAVLVGLLAVVLITGVILLRGGIGNALDRGGREIAEFRPPAVQCDSHYVGGCVPPYPPDLDCSDLEALRLPPVSLKGSDDPHGLDPDNDGVACN